MEEENLTAKKPKKTIKEPYAPGGGTPHLLDPPATAFLMLDDRGDPPGALSLATPAGITVLVAAGPAALSPTAKHVSSMSPAHGETDA